MSSASGAGMRWRCVSLKRRQSSCANIFPKPLAKASIGKRPRPSNACSNTCAATSTGSAHIKLCSVILRPSSIILLRIHGSMFATVRTRLPTCACNSRTADRRGDGRNAVIATMTRAFDASRMTRQPSSKHRRRSSPLGDDGPLPSADAGCRPSRHRPKSNGLQKVQSRGGPPTRARTLTSIGMRRVPDRALLCRDDVKLERKRRGSRNRPSPGKRERRDRGAGNWARQARSRHRNSWAKSARRSL